MSKQYSGHKASWGEKFGPTEELHKEYMGAIWGPGANIAILLAFYNYRKIWSWIHGIYFLLAVVMTLVSSIPILTTTGIIQASEKLYAHYIIGIVCFSAVGLVAILGLLTKMLNIFQANTRTILIVRKIHSISGYLIVLLCKVNIYVLSLGWIVQDIAFGVLFILWKLFFPRLEAKEVSPKHNSNAKLKQVRSIKELDSSLDYVVFANYVYDTAPLRNNHPAGYQIINAVRNKEVDRYIYGSCANEELPDLPVWSHSYKSFTLLQTPVARVQIPPTFEGFDTAEVECEVPLPRCISEKGRIYQINLSKKNGAFRFLRYTEVSQIGRYFSLSLNEKVTRLYTTVNFLVTENVQFLYRYLNIPQQSIPFQKPEQGQATFNQSKIQSVGSDRGLAYKIVEMPNASPAKIRDKASSIPILFKSYHGGKFSEGILKAPIRNIFISQSKGEGLQLAHTKPGIIIMVVGGTGVYPFSDLIDLLYKEQLMLRRPQIKNQVLALSPVLADYPFTQFQFDILAAFAHLEDIHPITLGQLLFLADSGRIRLTLRLKENTNGRVKETPNVRLSQTSFEQLLTEVLDKEEVSRVWICGPPRMNEGVSRFLRQKYNRPEQYLIV